ncbi:lanthionine synthetase LanC family protein [Rathayibacter toxicus]|uniref:lanthionine synthetase LanC family protein n=1 Tax=Rathayibacter toxicus TaxID=145458 RepID=UPI00358F781B
MGVLFTLASIADLYETPEELQFVSDFADKLSHGFDYHSIGFDFISGDSGNTLAFIRLNELTGNPVFTDMARQSTNSLVGRLPSLIFADEVPGGFAHGLSGVAVALCEAARHLGISDLVESSGMCLELKDFLSSQGRLEDHGYPHPGVGVQPGNFSHDCIAGQPRNARLS